jgi:SAM-dependent methyltransferase
VSERPTYLRPYDAAAARHGAGFGALLWASPKTQAVRFDALARAADFAGRRVLDVGCGRADLLDFLVARGERPAHYTGIEGVPALAAAALAKHRVPDVPVQIIEADFVVDPHRLFVGADVVAISGSLNTLEPAAFYATIRRAYQAATNALVFNFLCSDRLAGADHLRWHPLHEVSGFVGTLSADMTALDDYLQGDCTVAVRKR